MLQKGGKPRQQREHVAGGPQHHQTCSEGQSRRKARSGTIITTDAPEHAVTAHEGDGGGGGRGGDGARSAMRTLRSGVAPRQRHEHAGSVQSSGQMRSGGQSKRTTRSGLDVTAARADRAREALVERPRRRRQRARGAPKMRLQRGERLAQRHEHARRVESSD